MANRLTASLQENLITLLAHNDDSGGLVANLADAALFEGDYRVVAERLIDYWRKFRAAPKDHTPDLFAEIIEDKNNRKAGTYRRILSNMLSLSAGINTVYVLDQLRTFTRLQRFKLGIVRAADQINARQEMALEEVEIILGDLLKLRENNFDPGLRLSDVGRLIESLQESTSEFVTGITELDKAGFVPVRGQLMLFIGVKGTGKSWFCIQIAKQALFRRKKVLHISLEMNEDQVQRRYYQSIFSVTKREASVQVAVIERNSLNKIDSLTMETVKPEFTLDSPNLLDELNSHVRWFESKLNDLIIKRFPTRGLTVQQLEAYLDALESTEGFVPDLVVLDYPGIMKTQEDNHRISLGRVVEDLRGLAVRRNFALVAPHQSQRAGADAILVTSKHVAEDWSVVMTADNVVAISKTDAEKRLGLARLWVSHARDEGDAFGVLITQSYDLGQFVLDSIRLSADYKDRLNELVGEHGEEEDPED